MFVKMWEPDSFFDFSFNSYLKECMSSENNIPGGSIFFRVSADNLADLIISSDRLIMSDMRIILVSSRRCLPLAIFFTQMMTNFCIIFRGGLYSQDSDLSEILPDKGKVITPREFHALKLSVSHPKNMHLADLNKKTFYSRRRSALNKLGFKSINEFFLF